MANASTILATAKVNQSSMGAFVAQDIIVTNMALEIVDNVLDVGIMSALAILGIVTNVIDIAVFTKQGFQDSVNISLTAMAVWDLLKCVIGLAMRVYGPLGWYSPLYRKIWKNITSPTLLYLQVFANYVSYILASYVALERCLCVCIPFKVKLVITPRLTFVTMIVISTLVMVSFGIIFFVYDIYWALDPAYNQSVVVYSYNAFYNKSGTSVLEYFTFIGMLNPIFAFVVIVICTIIIVYQLRKMSQFRIRSAHKVSAGGKNNKDMSTRDKQVVKMLLVVIIAYILALIPRLALHVGKLINVEFYYLKTYHNLFTVCAYGVMTVDFLNASVHLFIYLTMSSNFRHTFLQLFPWCERAKKVGV